MILIKEHNISVTITVINTHIIKSDLKIFTFNRQWSSHYRECSTLYQHINLYILLHVAAVISVKGDNIHSLN